MSRYRIPLDLANQASPPPDEEEVRQACAEVEARLRSLFPQHELALDPGLVFPEVEGAASDLTEVLRAARDLCRDWLATRRGGALETEAEVRTPRTSAARLVRLEETRDRSFDREFWSAASPAERFRAGWQLVEDYLALRGRLDERRLRRSVAELRPLRG